MKKNVSLFVIIALMITTLMPQVTFAEVIQADTPIDAVGLKWKFKPEGRMTPPLLYGNYIYVGVGSHIYKLNKTTGSVVGTAQLSGGVGYATIPPTVNDGVIYIGVNSGKIQAIDANTLKSLWISKTTGVNHQTGQQVKISGQTISPIVYYKDSIYTGTMDGQFIAINAKGSNAGTVRWVVSDANGYYWSGAYASDSAIVFGADSYEDLPTEMSTITSVEPDTGEILSTISALGSVRSSVVTDDEGYLYLSSKSKKLYKLALAVDGKISLEGSINLSGASTGEPTYYNGALYIGTSGSKIDVVDTDNLSSLYSISAPGEPKYGNLIVDHIDGNTYLYTTYNMNPGGIAIGKLRGSDTILNKNFFTPVDKQFCLSPVIADTASGIIYYKNDANVLMAIDHAEYITMGKPSVKRKSYNSLTISWPKTAMATGYDLFRSTSAKGTYTRIGSFGSGTTSYVNTKLKTGANYYYKVKAKYSNNSGSTIYGKESAFTYAKPVLNKPKIKTSKKKKAVKLSWKKVSGASGYVIYRATKKKGKYKKVKTIKKGSTRKWTNKKLKSKKKYYYKIRAYRKVSGKKVYSVYSNISYKKTK